MSAIVRYRLMSWIPVAKVSNVGASPPVIRERRDDTAVGDTGCREMGDEVEGGSCWDCDSARCWPALGCIDAKIACCEESNREGSIVSGCVGRLDDSGCDGSGICSSFGGCFGGLIEGIEGGRRSAFKACFSCCNLRPVVYQQSF